MHAPVKPTEDVEKVRRAVENVFSGELVVESEGGGYYRVVGFSNDLSSLSRLRDLIIAKQIRTAARSYLFKRALGNSIVILLHKQAAYVNSVSLVDSDRESPLGAIRIEIESDSVAEVVDWLAPPLHRARSI